MMPAMQFCLDSATAGTSPTCVACSARAARHAAACWVVSLLALVVVLLRPLSLHISSRHSHVGGQDPLSNHMLHPGPVFSMDMVEAEEEHSPAGTAAPILSQGAYNKYVEEVLEHWVQERQQTTTQQHSIMTAARAMPDNSHPTSKGLVQLPRYTAIPETSTNTAMLLYSRMATKGCHGKPTGTAAGSMIQGYSSTAAGNNRAFAATAAFRYQPTAIATGLSGNEAGTSARPLPADDPAVWQATSLQMTVHAAVHSIDEVDDALAWLYYEAMEQERSKQEPMVFADKTLLEKYLDGIQHQSPYAHSDTCCQHKHSEAGLDVRPGVRQGGTRRLAQLSGTALNAVSGVVQRNIAFNCSTLSGLPACAEPLCFDVFSLVRTDNGSVVCQQTGTQSGPPPATLIIQPYAYDYFFNFNQNLVLFGFSVGLDFQSIIRARAREPSGDDWYNYIIRTRNARASAGSFTAVDYSNVYSLDTPFASLGINTVQPFTYNIRYSPYTAINTIQTRQVVPGYTNNGLAVLTSAQYTVFGNTGLPWLP